MIPVGAAAECKSKCASSGYQYQIDCVTQTPCDKIAATCGGVVNETGSKSGEGTSSSGGSSSGGD
jgi:hypothetical protein